MGPGIYTGSHFGASIRSRIREFWAVLSLDLRMCEGFPRPNRSLPLDYLLENQRHFDASIKSHVRECCASYITIFIFPSSRRVQHT